MLRSSILRRLRKSDSNRLGAALVFIRGSHCVSVQLNQLPNSRLIGSSMADRGSYFPMR